MVLLRTVVISIMSFLISACASSPHDNFKAHMSHTVGKKIDSSSTWARSDRFIRKETLPNGNIENEYEFRRTCMYFFEYEPSSLIIVGWRYEGKESDCEIAP